MELLETLAFLVVFIAWILRAMLSPIAKRRKQQREMEEAIRQPQTQPQQPVRREQRPVQQQSQPPAEAQAESAQPVRKTAVELLRELGLDLEATAQEEPREARPRQAESRETPSREWRSASGEAHPEWLPPPPVPAAPPVQTAPPVQRPSARRDRAKPPPQALQSLPPIPEMADAEIQAPIKLPKVGHTAADAASARLRADLLNDLRGGPVGLRRAVLLTEILGPAPGLQPAHELGRGTVSPPAAP